MKDARFGIGIIGAGDISRRYIDCLRAFEPLNLVGIASQSLAAGSSVNGLESFTLEALLGHEEVDLIVNLTPPKAHARITSQALQTGNHVYSEKPLAHSRADANDLVALAARHDRVLACAPATHLGPAQQTVRKMIDAGELGEIVGASASVVYAGPDRWHHSPAALFGTGAGPLFDLGVYYVSAFVHWFGSVRRVSAVGRTMQPTRKVHAGPRTGQTFAVTVPTHVVAWMEFDSGVVASLTTSFDSPGSKASAIEVYGTEGSLMLAAGTDGFSASIEQCKTYNSWASVPSRLTGWSDPWWAIGIIDTADAIYSRRPARACASVALHVLDVLTALEEASSSASHVTVTTRCERPAGFSISPIDQQFPALHPLKIRKH